MQKILFMLTGIIMDNRYLVNIHILNDYIKKLSTCYTVDVACISGRDDFEDFEEILPFKYKVINPNKQLDKICDFVSECAESYDWYVKIRAEVKLLEQLDFSSFCPDSINTRTRVYNGPLSVKHGSSVGGIGSYERIHATHYSPELKEIVVDEMLYIFSRAVVEKGGFAPITDEERGRKDWYFTSLWNQHEWFHTAVWNSRKIPFHIVSLNVDFTRSGFHSFPGDINLPPCKYRAEECPDLRIH